MKTSCPLPLLIFALMALLIGNAFGASSSAKLRLEKKDLILFYGNSMIERLMEDGRFEALIHLAHPNSSIRIRSLAWSGDEVGNRLRPEGYANHLKNLLKAWPAKAVVLGFGRNEAFNGIKGLETFRVDLRTYLNEIKRRHPSAKIVLLSPLAAEQTISRHFPVAETRNTTIKEYVQVMAEQATQQNVAFINLFEQSKIPLRFSSGPALTRDGSLLNHEGLRWLAYHLAHSLIEGDFPQVNQSRLENIALAASQKAALAAKLTRPVNAVIYYGVRARPEEYETEMPRYHRLVEQAETVLHSLASSPVTPFIGFPPPSLPPLIENKSRPPRNPPGTILSPHDQMATIEVAKGFQLNLFASEEEFPDLKNPVQIAFDHQGRLWVVTMPSFPHTVPGEKENDKILILEDTDRDGKADRQMIFADGLSVPDGIAFHEDGAIVSIQPKLYFMKDSDGDGRADIKRELIRGIDVTDAHHGGMIAMDPLGHIIFCDGVFHRSQIETPYGVVRGIDATTYRLDLNSMRINTEYQTITPNPWKVTFDRWGNLFQMYGDGFVQDSHAVPWTPLGVYQPFKRAISLDYGKGSGVAVISSPNFPADYQQGLASATLLGKYFVAISKHTAESGYYHASERLDLIASENAAFRPVDIAFGFDGAMYVSDYCSPIIGHAQHPMRDPQWDHTHGRIWRVTYEKNPVVKDWPEFAAASNPELLTLLKHPQDLVRDHARIQLRHRLTTTTDLDLWVQGLNRDSDSYYDLILEALRLYHSKDQTKEPLLRELLKSEDERHRAAAVHLIRFQADQIPQAETLLRSLANDPHPRVRLQLITTLSHLQRDRIEWASLLGEIDTEDLPDLQTVLEDASHGVTPALGPEVPVLQIDPTSQLTHWLTRETSVSPRLIQVGPNGNRENKEALVDTYFIAPEATRATLSLRHQHVTAQVNGAQILKSSTWWSSDWNVQLPIRKGLNQIKIDFQGGDRAQGIAPVFLYDGTGNPLKGIEFLRSEASLVSLESQYNKENGLHENLVTISAVPNQLAFTPNRIELPTDTELIIRFENPDLMIHNLVIADRESGEHVGTLADKLALQPNAIKRGYIPESTKVLAATPLVHPNAKAEILFRTPSTPGDYPFLCTFPGHWRVMRGLFIVR
jgi:glucose/arabinose dehydrogenase/azurin